ncbi:MAG: ankyrin repeat domain-containing protein [Alphaproteobacteria bacterium]|nr:ankyrin repeat domain-containing protein [Alphaproteobacteria bacterium]
MHENERKIIIEALQSNDMQTFKNLSEFLLIPKYSHNQTIEDILNLVLVNENDSAFSLLLDMGLQDKYHGRSILTLVAKFASGKTIEKLIESHRSLLGEQLWYISPMAEIILALNISAAKVLLDEMSKQKFPPENILKEKYVLIRRCISDKDYDKLSQAILSFPEVVKEENDFSKSDKTNLLVFACIEKSSDALIQLLEAGGKFSNQCADMSLISMAATFADFRAMKGVIELGGGINAKYGVEKKTALDIALEHQNFSAAIALLEYRAKSSQVAKYAGKLCSEAIKIGSDTVLRQLIDAHHINMHTLCGDKTALDFALEHQNFSAAIALLEYGAKSSQVAKYARLLCSEAIKIGNNTVLSQLIDAYPIKNKNKQTAPNSLIPVAYTFKNDEAIRILLNAGETFHITPMVNHTHEKKPLQSAVEFISDDTINLLMQKANNPKTKENRPEYNQLIQAIGFYSIYKKDYKRLRALLSSKNSEIFTFNDDSLQSNRNQLLHCAIHLKDEEALRILVEYGADIKERIKYISPSEPPLETSDDLFLLIAPFASARMIRDLISKGATINTVIPDTPSPSEFLSHLPFYQALINGNLDAAEQLIMHDLWIKRFGEFGGFMSNQSFIALLLEIYQVENETNIQSNILNYKNTIKPIKNSNDEFADGSALRFMNSFPSNPHIVPFIKLLAKIGANLDVKYNEHIDLPEPPYKINYSPLVYAFIFCDFKTFFALKEHGATIDPSLLRLITCKAAFTNTTDYDDFAESLAIDVVNALYFEALERAISAKNTNECKKLIENGARIDYRDVNGNTLLHRMIKQDHLVEDIIYILELGADINKQSNAGNSALHLAVLQKNDALVNLLLSYGADVTIKNNKGNTPLHLAVLKNSIPNIDILYHGGADVRIPNNKGKKPLDVDSKNKQNKEAKGHLEVLINNANHCDRWGQNKLHLFITDEPVSTWINQGLDISKPDVDGYTPLHLAVLHQNEILVSQLLKHNAPCNTAVNGVTPLHHAAALGNVSLVNLLISHGSSINAIDTEGLTPLDYALSCKNAEELGAVEKTLLENGAAYGDDVVIKEPPLEMQHANDETSVPRKYQYTRDENNGQNQDINLLHRMIKQGHVVDVDFIHAICSSGADINKPATDGNSALHLAVWYGNEDLVHLLLNHGANANIQNNKGNTPLHLAVLKNSIAKINILYGGGANVRIPNNKGRKPHDVDSKNKQNKEAKEHLEGLIKHANSCDSWGQNKLHLLVIEEPLSTWMKQGLDILKPDCEGFTPLHRAVLCGNEILASQLLKHNASCNTVANNGATPLHHAAQIGNVVLVNLLISYGAPINAHDELGFTPLDYALSCNDTEKFSAVKKTLLENGAVPSDYLVIKEPPLERQYANDEPSVPRTNQLPTHDKNSHLKKESIKSTKTTNQEGTVKSTRYLS